MPPIRKRYIFFLLIIIIASTFLLIDLKKKMFVETKMESFSKLGAPLFNHQGYYHHMITTNSPRTQRYFDQGLIFFYSLNYTEAIRSFTEGIRLDPRCAICYWGLSLSWGSKDNILSTDRETKNAVKALKKALEYSQESTPLEQAYIEALASRYIPFGSQNYVLAMKSVMERFPLDVDAKNLYAAALFDNIGYNIYTRNRLRTSEGNEIIHAMNEALKIEPENPVSHYFYALAMEYSEHPEQGIASAEFLRKSAPKIERFINTSSHIYMLTGQYQNASAANRRAVGAHREYIGEAWSQGFEPEKSTFYLYNIDLLCCAATLEGKSRLALDTAEDLVRQVPRIVATDSDAQTFYAVPYLTKIQFKFWSEILKEPPPAENLTYQKGIWHYARGMAFLHLENIERAEEEKQLLEQSQKQRKGLRRLNIASEILEATIAEHKGDEVSMIEHWQRAVALEEEIQHDAPFIWYFQAKNGLANALFKAERLDEAEIAYLEALKQYPENGRSLFGLQQTLSLQGRDQEASDVELRFEKAWLESDVIP